MCTRWVHSSLQLKNCRGGRLCYSKVPDIAKERDAAALKMVCYKVLASTERFAQLYIANEHHFQ